MGIKELFEKLRANYEKKENTQIAVGDPYLIVGLGNPGRDYRLTRHNIGFMAIDRLAESMQIHMSRVQFSALTGTGVLGDKKIMLVKPQTFMNLSGQAVGALAKFYKVPLERIIVTHDDLDLPLGTVRIRPGGGSAGQKGVASIIERLGTQDFARIRLGIGHPGGAKDAADYVLSTFSRSEQDVLAQVLDRAVAAAKVFVESDIEKAMNLYNGIVQEGQ
jgi:PTH1 family peptidyl-tRNA hydrolase